MPVKILLANNWVNALKKCDWLIPHHLFFDDVQKIIDYCQQHTIDIIFANNYRTQNFLENHQAVLKANNLKFLVNRRYVIDTFADKLLFNRFMTNNGFSEYIAKDYDKNSEVQFPCIVKPIMGGAGRGVHIAYLPDDLKDVDRNNNIISEYLIGPEFATSIFYQQHQVINHFSYRKTSNQAHYVLQQAKQPLVVEKCVTPFLDIFARILKIANPNGESCQCSINYKIINNQPKIFEINCRIGYTLACFPDDFKIFMDSYIASLNTAIPALENNFSAPPGELFF